MRLNIRALQNLVLMIVTGWMISPPLLVDERARLVALGAMLTWGGLELIRKRNILLYPTLPVVGAAVVILHDLLLWYMYRETPVTAGIPLYIFLSFVLIYESRRDDPRTLAPVFWFVLFLSPVWLYRTYQAIHTLGSHAARIVVRSSEAAFELAEQGVGGYGLIYGVVPLVPILLALTLRPRSFDYRSAPWPLADFPRALRVSLAAILGVTLWVILVAGYSIAVLTTALLLPISLASLHRNRGAVSAALVVGLALILTVAWLGDDIIRFLYPLSTDYAYLNKLEDLQQFHSGGEAVGTVSDRTERYLKSLLTFLENPVFGTFSSHGSGGHSAFLDRLARGGAVFGGIYIALVLYLPVRMLRALPHNRGMVIGMLLVMSIVPLINTMPMSIGVALYIVFPVACALTMDYQTRLRLQGGRHRAGRFWRRIGA